MIRCENLAAVLFFSLTGLDLSLWAVGKGFFFGALKRADLAHVAPLRRPVGFRLSLRLPPATLILDGRCGMARRN
jgi:hypothetical protein